MDAHERIVTAAGSSGQYESMYLKANSPDGQRGFWLKHNTLHPVQGPAKAEVWVVLFERGVAPVVSKTEVPWPEVHAASDRVALRAGAVSLAIDRAVGRAGGTTWDLGMTSPGAPLFHLPFRRFYTAGFPKKKMMTAAPNLRFHGRIGRVGQSWDVDGWVGLRGHNWGSEHAWSYAYGNCNTWDDGDPVRTIDGFTVQIRVAGVLSPWLSLLVGRGPDVSRNRLRDWFAHSEIGPAHWRASWPGRRREATSVEMNADPSTYVGLRYTHPDGRESACYNTKFADVRYQLGNLVATSSCGELEVMFPDPLPDIPLHPSPGWSQASDGDYDSG